MTKLLLILKKCLGEARWTSRYTTWRDKFEVFKILFRLRYHAEILDKEDGNVSQNIFGYHVTGTSYKELLYLFREIFMDGQYVFSTATRSPSIIDCGANIGMAVVYFKKMYPDCTILAFEPNPVVFEMLRKNVTRNQLTGVKVINAGLSNTEGVFDFFVNEKNSLISSLDMNRNGSVHAIPIKTVRLSTFLQGTRFDFAKIDVEGAEVGVMDDLNESDTIAHIDQYIFEYHHNIENSALKLSDFLKSFEKNDFTYNLKTSFGRVGDFQDIAIHLIKR